MTKEYSPSFLDHLIWPSPAPSPTAVAARNLSSGPTSTSTTSTTHLFHHVLGRRALHRPQGRRRLCSLPQGQDKVRLRKRPRALQELRQGHARVLSALGEHGAPPRTEPSATRQQQRPPPCARFSPGRRRRCHRRQAARSGLDLGQARPSRLGKVSCFFLFFLVYSISFDFASRLWLSAAIEAI